MDVFEVVAEPARRVVLELLATGERPAGDAVALLAERFGLSQPAVSRHLRVLREAGLVTTRVDGARRVYALVPTALEPLRRWADVVARGEGAVDWQQRLDALETEVVRRRHRGTAGRGRGASASAAAGGA